MMDKVSVIKPAAPGVERKPASSSLRADRFLVLAASHVVLIVATIVIVYPVVWMLLASLKTRTEIVSNVLGLPKSLAWENYQLAWETAKLGNALFNSVVVSASIVILVTVFAATAGYAFAKLQFRYSTAIFAFFVLTMFAGAPTIALYVMLVRLRLTDSYLGLILPSVAGGLPLSIFIFRAFFLSIPTELVDAGKVDGCSDLGVFARIVAPISGPAIATVSILQFVGAWNEYFLPLILIRTPEMRTVPLAIQVFFYSWGRTEWAQVFAALSIGSLPMIILYIIMQRQFIQGLVAGAVKG